MYIDTDERIARKQDRHNLIIEGPPKAPVVCLLGVVYRLFVTVTIVCFCSTL